MKKIIYTLVVVFLFLPCSSKTANRVQVKKFKEPENTAVFTTKFVIVDKKDITTVYHDKEDGAWQFMSEGHFDDFSTVAKLVGLGQIVKIDSTLTQVADMPRGYFAHRKSKGEKWVIEK